MKIRFFFLLVYMLMMSCSDDSPENYSASDLDLITKNVETSLTAKVGEELLLQLDYENAIGELLFVWTIGNKVVSKRPIYPFIPTQAGQYFISVYVEDAQGKYTNVQFKIEVEDEFAKNKVIAGYYSTSSSEPVPWNKITHLIYSYVYPTSEGSLQVTQLSRLQDYVEEAKKHDVKVLLSLGSLDNYPGKGDRVFTNVLNDEEKRKNLVNFIYFLLVGYELQGVDILYDEFEGNVVDYSQLNNMVPFLKELRDILPYDMIITCSVTGGYGWKAYHYRDIAADMADVADFISVMAFDNFGTWEDSPLGRPSSLEDAKNALDRYVNFGVPQNKLVLGVPFFGRDFLRQSGGIARPISYLDLLGRFVPTETELATGHINRDGHNIFFNSQSIISEKINYVKMNNFRGISAWQLEQDSGDEELSLLKNVHNQIN
ncbi:glycoside hydrolase family 18 protein [Fulvivirga sediminis]|uniref:GH18 domain-containing protein n=1 Tax=Fulvivirga sediminis TaxID=2803949 RepID=A0A937K0I9_9BACT|nr:glycoside hydrolase family 18 protein [Fulvivirga sediminis]MBL3658403.1 hypothetical protein [Fulvivirga sediminis]